MRGQTMFYVDQYNHQYVASTVKSLRQKVGGGRVSKMFVDTLKGETVHVGYVIGPYWLTAFIPFEGK